MVEATLPDGEKINLLYFNELSVTGKVAAVAVAAIVYSIPFASGWVTKTIVDRVRHNSDSTEQVTEQTFEQDGMTEEFVDTSDQEGVDTSQ